VKVSPAKFSVVNVVAICGLLRIAGRYVPMALS
jgi:hypothetical protein